MLYLPAFAIFPAQGKTVLAADASGNVSTKEVVSAVENYYGKNPIARKLAITVMAYIKQAEQDSFSLCNSILIYFAQYSFISSNFHTFRSIYRRCKNYIFKYVVYLR